MISQAKNCSTQIYYNLSMQPSNKNISPSWLIQQVVEEMLSVEKEKSLEYTYLLPSQRSCVVLRECLRQRFKGKGFVLPKIYPFMNWMSEISDIALLSPWELQLLFWQIYQHHFPTERFSSYLIQSKVFFSDFNEIDYSLADAESLFENLQYIEDLEATFSRGKIRKKERGHIEKMKLSYRLLTQILEKRGLGYAGYIARRLLQNIQNIELDNNYAVIGLNAFNTAEEKILRHLQQNTKLRFYWDADHHYMADPLWGAGHFLRKNKSYFGLERDFKYVDRGLSSHKKVREVRCTTPLEQTYYLRDALKKHIEENQNLSSCAVILLDETLLPTVMEQLPKRAFPCNVTMGKPLNFEPLYIFLLDTCALFFTAALIEKTVLESWLKNRFAGYLFESDSYLKNALKLLCVSQKSHFKRADLHIFLAHSQAKAYLMREEKLHKTAFSLLLDTLQRIKPCLVLNLEQAAADQLSVILECLVRQDQKYHLSVHTEDVKQILMEAAKGVKISFKGDPSEGLQIMGLLETRALDFQTLFILSLSEGIFPANASSPSYLPQDIRSKFGLNLPVFQEQVMSYHFFRLLQRAQEIHLLYAESSQDISLKEPSRFLSQIEYELGSNYDYKKINVKNQNPLRLPEEAFLGWRNTQNTLEKLLLLLKGGVSVTGIGLLFSDPLLFLKQKVLDVQTFEPRSNEADQRVLGSLLHKVLEILYTDFLGKQLHTLSLEGKSLVSEAFDQALFKNDYGYDWKEGAQGFVLEDILKPTILEFFIADTKRVLEILACEQKLTATLPPTQKFPEITLTGIIDQIRREEGEVNIIDFKLSSSHFQWKLDMNQSFEELQDFFIRYPYNLQFLLYAYLYLKNHPIESRVKVSGIFFKEKGSKKTLSIIPPGSSVKVDYIEQSDLVWIEESILIPIFSRLEQGFSQLS